MAVTRYIGHRLKTCSRLVTYCWCSDAGSLLLVGGIFEGNVTRGRAAVRSHALLEQRLRPEGST